MSSLAVNAGWASCSEQLSTTQCIQLAFQQELEEFNQKMLAQLALLQKHEICFQPAHENLASRIVQLDAAQELQFAVGMGFPIKPTSRPEEPIDDDWSAPVAKVGQPHDCPKEEEAAQSHASPDASECPTSQCSERWEAKRNALDSLPVTAPSGRNQKSVMSIPDMLEGALNVQLGGRRKDRKNWCLCPEMTLETQQFLSEHPYRGSIRIAVLHPSFDMIFGSVVLTSVLTMGIGIEMAAQDYDFDTMRFFWVQVLCCSLFLLEVTMRLIAFGYGFFGFGPGSFVRDWKWNQFDTFCTVLMVFDLTDEFLQKSKPDNAGQAGAFIEVGQGRLVCFFRLMRIVRALRILRMANFARELRKMSYALQHSIHTLMWAMLLLSFVMYFFATAFTQATTEALSAADSESSTLSDLQKMYGAVGSSYFSLFQAVTGGDDWIRLIEPLRKHTHWIYSVLFVTFVAMTVFGVTNVIMSVFVESALASVQHYKDLLISENKRQKEVYVTHLREVFRFMDHDQSGEISAAEMERLLTDDELKQYLESIEIHPDDAHTLFRLLDRDNSGQVSIDEFCNGCLKLKGEAKSYDIHCIIYENKRMLHKWSDYMTYLEKGFLPKLLKAVRQEIMLMQRKETPSVLAATDTDQSARTITVR